MTLKKLRNIQNIISSVIFLVILSFFCYTTNLHLTEIQLSHWSTNNKFSWLWNSSVIMLAFSFYFNYKDYIKTYQKINNKQLINILFSTTTLCLFLTGIITSHYLFYHTIVAWTYFLLAPISIFTFTHFNIKNISLLTWKTNLSQNILTSIKNI